ncbi:MAG: hypothetical protein NVSMB30_31720 [Hymenobacter sp.]
MAAGLAGCSKPCTGSIETTVLFAKPGARGGRVIYVDVVNKPGLGIKKTLLYEGKEFGTFEHVVLINDPTSNYASNSSICFSEYAPEASATTALADDGIPQIRITR